MAVSVGLLLCWQVEASSRSSSPRHSRRSPRRKKRKRRTAPDPHDVSSSSPSFVPLMFTEDEREQDILSALARLETEGDDDEKEASKEKPTVKKAKRIVKKAMSGSRVEHKPKQEEDTTKASVAPPIIESPPISDSPAKTTESMQVKETAPTLTNAQHSVTALEEIKRSPTKLAAETIPDYPPRPVWKRLEQQTVQKLPSMTSSVPPTTRTMPSVHNPTSKYPYVPGSSTQTAPKQQQSHEVDANSSTTSLWIRKFLSARPKDTLLPIPREYLSDGFNLVQLAPIVEKIGRMKGGYIPPALQSSDTSFPLFKAALRLILSNDDGPTPLSVQRAAEVLYVLVHARYAISPRGLDTVRRVLCRSDGTVNPVFGRCPRIRCRGMPLLPCGDSDSFDPRNSVSTRTKRYCSCCREVRGLISTNLALSFIPLSLFVPCFSVYIEVLHVGLQDRRECLGNFLLSLVSNDLW